MKLKVKLIIVFAVDFYLQVFNIPW